MAASVTDLIIKGAQARNLDPAAVMAISNHEGLSGRIGDGGHAFGPFQMNDAGGVLTDKFPNWTADQKQQWASSPAGINYALDGIAKIASGLTGPAAVHAIAYEFERPTDKPGEVSDAIAHLANWRDLQWGGGPLGSSPGGGGGGSPGAANDASHYGVGDPADAVAFARKYIGTPYSYGGGSESGPTYGQQQGANIKGFDCSGLVQSAFLHAGLHDVGRTTFQQWGEGTAVNPGQLLPGDAVYYKGSDSQTDAQGNVLPGHVALYVGNGNVIVAPQTGEYVKLAPMNSISDYMGARRFFSTPDQGAKAATTAVTAIGHKSFPPPKATNAPVQAKTPLGPALPAAIPASSAAGDAAFKSLFNSTTPPRFAQPAAFKPAGATPGLPPSPTPFDFSGSLPGMNKPGPGITQVGTGATTAALLGR